MRRRADRGLIAAGVVSLLIGAAAIAAVIATGSGHEQRLPTSGPSMQPTLQGPSRVDVDYAAYDSAPPQRGDIVVVQAPAGFERGCQDPASTADAHTTPAPCVQAPEGYSRQRLLKRIVAGPGDQVEFAGDGRVVLNGKHLGEPYVRPCVPPLCRIREAITVPDDHWFVAGDNRGNSLDSRWFGAIPTSAIDGRVTLTGSFADPRQ